MGTGVGVGVGTGVTVDTGVGVGTGVGIGVGAGIGVGGIAATVAATLASIVALISGVWAGVAAGEACATGVWTVASTSLVGVGASAEEEHARNATSRAITATAAIFISPPYPHPRHRSTFPLIPLISLTYGVASPPTPLLTCKYICSIINRLQVWTRPLPSTTLRRNQKLGKPTRPHPRTQRLSPSQRPSRRARGTSESRHLLIPTGSRAPFPDTQAMERRPGQSHSGPAIPRRDPVS